MASPDRAAPVSATPDSEVPVSAVPNPAAETWAHELLRALDRLEPMQRVIVGSVYFEGETRECAARRMSLSADAVGKYLASGMQALGAFLREAVVH